MPRASVQDTTILYGLSRSKQTVIQWLDATVPVGTAGQFTEVNLVGATVTIGPSHRLNITVTGGGGSQSAIQFQDEGINLGTPGTVDTINWTGAAVTASRVGNVVTVNVAAASSPLTTKGDLWGFSTLDARVPVGTNGQVLTADSTQALGVKWANGVSTVTRGPGCSFDGGGVALIGTIVRQIEVPYGFAGTGWTIVANTTGNASIDVKHSTYAAFPTMTTLLTATLSSAQKNQATGLTFSLSAGDILQFEGSGFSGLTVCAITLDGTGN